MIQEQARQEAEIMETVAARLAAQGFVLSAHPSEDERPAFLRNHEVDAIATNGERHIVIEIKRGRRGVSARTERLRSAIAGHKNWGLQIIYAPEMDAGSDGETQAVATRADIEQLLDRTLAALDLVGPVSALLTTWAAFEAAAWYLLAPSAGAPRASRDLIELLAGEGYVTPDEAEDLRRIAALRNRAAHGDLSVSILQRDLEQVAGLARQLIAAKDPPALSA